MTSSSSRLSRTEAFWLWLKIGVLSFGGPAGQIALMHRLIVDEKKLLDENRFLHALNYCMLLPGPEAQQLTVYTGWLLHGVSGGIVAGLLFVIPGAIVIWILSVLYALYANVAIVDGLFFGVKTAVLAIVVQAIVRISSKVLTKPILLALAVFGFVSTFVLHLPFPFVVAGAAVIGFVAGRLFPEQFAMKNDHAAKHDASANDSNPPTGRTLMVAAVFMVLWAIPLIWMAMTLGRGHVFTEEGLFFSKLAVVTFGGAYAVLSYMTQAVVNGFGWLSTGQMIDGLGMAETTPGPLILVVQFVGFLAAYQNPGSLHPIAAGTLGSLIALWVTFVPCFVWIFLGAPFVETLRGNTSISTALSAITAVVVGVIASLALWFASHVLFADFQTGAGHVEIPVWSSLKLFALILTVANMVALMILRVPVLWVIAASAIIAMAYRLVV